MFKNLVIYRIAPSWVPDLEAAEQALAAARFVPCGESQMLSAGFVEPRGHAGGAMVEPVGAGQWVAKLMVERKILPGTVVAKRMEELAQRIERETGRKPGRRAMKELKERAQLELLPQAFTKLAAVTVWIDTQRSLLCVDAPSVGASEAVVTALVKTLPGFGVRLLQTHTSAQSGMSAWLTEGEAPDAFSLDRECELRAPDEMRSTVRYSRHSLDIGEIGEHIKAGKQPTKLALTWMGSVSFVLTDAMTLRRISFDDVVFESSKKDAGEEAFDADAVIATGELARLIVDLVETLGGELVNE